MVEGAKSFFKENSTLIYFLIGQAVFIGGLAFTGVSYMTTLENRVTTLEVRGSPHLSSNKYATDDDRKRDRGQHSSHRQNCRNHDARVGQDNSIGGSDAL